MIHLIGLSISLNKGKGNLEHNKRKLAYELANVDRKKSANNIVLVDDDLHQTYDNLFGQAVREHDLKTKRKDRKIVDYYDYVKQRQDKEKSQSSRLFKELVIQFGNRKQLDKLKISDDQLIAMYKKYIADFVKRNPNLHVFGAYIHLDELTPHLHLDFVPCSNSTNKRSHMSLTNSFDNALCELGYNAKKQRTAFKNWRNDEVNSIEKIYESVNLDHEVIGNFNAHNTNSNIELDYRYTNAVNKIVEEDSEHVAQMQSNLKPFLAKKSAFGDKVEVVEKEALDVVLKENASLKLQNKMHQKSLKDIKKANELLEKRDLESDGTYYKKLYDEEIDKYNLLVNDYNQLLNEYEKLELSNKQLNSKVDIYCSTIQSLVDYSSRFKTKNAPAFEDATDYYQNYYLFSDESLKIINELENEMEMK